MLLDPSQEGLFKLLVSYPAQALAVLTALAMILRFPVKTWWAWTVTAIGLIAFALRTALIAPHGTDIHYFWLAGCDVVNGLDPYRNEFCLNPPTAFPLYALFGSFSFAAVLFTWTALNAIGFCGVVVLARWALWTKDDNANRELSAPVLGVFTAALVLSVATGYGLSVGQMSLFTTLALLAVVGAWRRGWQTLAGMALALGTIKAATMLPFLLLFRRRKHVLAWVFMIATCLALYFASNPASEIVSRTRECLANIARMGTPGHMNYYAGGAINADMIAFDRTFYFSGVTDETAVKLLHWAAVLGSGAWIAWRLWGRRPWEPAAACCMVAFYSALFLYHRLYDMPILVLPLLYATVMARREAGATRWLYAGSATAILAVLYLRLEYVKTQTIAAAGPNPPSVLVQAIVIPHVVWLILAAMAAFAVAERRRTQKPTPEEVAALPGEALTFTRLQWADRMTAPPAMAPRLGRACSDSGEERV